MKKILLVAFLAISACGTPNIPVAPTDDEGLPTGAPVGIIYESPEDYCTRRAATGEVAAFCVNACLEEDTSRYDWCQE